MEKKKHKFIYIFILCTLVACLGVVSLCPAFAEAPAPVADNVFVNSNGQCFAQVNNYMATSVNGLIVSGQAYDPIFNMRLIVTYDSSNYNLYCDTTLTNTLTNYPFSLSATRINYGAILTGVRDLDNPLGYYVTWFYRPMQVTAGTVSNTYDSTLDFWARTSPSFDSSKIASVSYGNKDDSPLSWLPYGTGFTSTLRYFYNYIRFTDINGFTFDLVWCPQSMYYSPFNEIEGITLRNLVKSPSITYYSNNYLYDYFQGSSVRNDYWYNVGYDDGYDRGIQYAVENELGDMNSTASWVEFAFSALDTKIFGFISIKDMLLVVFGVTALGFIFKLLAV